ncbi:xanthine dehydrogenase family protein subunit M [uncultured Clostridium sp.]|uniref:FAD binding domain-containing protein n=1 Tax=uncultured Clostridium sp. TaxID=59620 RepID=UPI0025CDFEFB|nr:FAD binding domain-containing protein [uncultured Clostridium sp.]
MVGYYPVTIIEALQNMKAHENEPMVIVSGGTDVMVAGKKAENMIFLNEIDELRNITLEDGILKIGAECTYAEMIENEKIPEVLKKAIRKIASPAVRNSGTLSGNICNASPVGDSLPILYALSAVVVTQYLNNKEEIEVEKIPIEKFILGIRKTALKKEAIVTYIEIPLENYTDISRLSYEKVGARQSEAISKLSFIGILKVKEEKITDARIAFGSVGIKTMRRTEIENQIIGLTLDELDFKKEEFVEKYSEIITPIDDQRSTAEYRKKVCLNLLREFLSKDGDA